MEPQTIDVLENMVPLRFDILQFLANHDPDRAAFKLWQTDPSGNEGCVSLVSPKSLVPLSSLSSPKVPILALTDALETDFISVERPVEHFARGGRYYDSRDINTNRNYLQCALAPQSLFFERL